MYIGFQRCTKLHTLVNTDVLPVHSDVSPNCYLVFSQNCIHILNKVFRRSKYCETAFSRIGISQMWILQNSKELSEHLESANFIYVTSIKSVDFPRFMPPPYLDRNKTKTDLQELSETRSFKNMVTIDKNILYQSMQKHFVWRNTLIVHQVDSIFVVFAEKVFVLLYLRSPKDGCCSISDDLSCSSNKQLAFQWVQIEPFF